MIERSTIYIFVRRGKDIIIYKTVEQCMRKPYFLVLSRITSSMNNVWSTKPFLTLQHKIRFLLEILSILEHN